MIGSTESVKFKDESSWLTAYLNRLRQSRFYGKIIIDIKEGSIVLLRKEETIKPPAGDKKAGKRT